MALQIFNENLLTSRAQALILTIDGKAKGMEGNIARAYGRKYPEVWEEIECEVKYPSPLGSVQGITVDKNQECPQRLICLAATLHHIEVLSDDEKLSVVRTALRNSLHLAQKYRITRLATSILTGGWRLPHKQAFTAMLQVYESFCGGNSELNLCIYIINKEGFDNVARVLKQKNYLLSEVEGGYSVCSPVS